MSHSHPSGLLAAYNSLTDKHLAGYFNNTRIRRHLLRSGLITRSGRILSEKEYKLNIMKRDHQKYIRECLAQAIFHKVLDMEVARSQQTKRYHQLEIKKKLETLARKERIQRFKTAPRPYTAPGITQPPIRLQPLPSNPAVRTVPKITPGSRSKTSPLENEAPFPIGGKKAMMKYRNSMDSSQGMNQYHLLNVNNYTVPIPPPSPPPNGKITRGNRPETWRRRRFRPTTAPNGLEPAFTRDSRRINKTPPHSNAVITMIYLGKNVHLSYDYPDFGDEIKVYQQHCGGENLCVYKGKLLEKETFQFISKRHHGFPFSLTFFLNGMQVNRLSSCCEYKHRKGSRLGGKGGYFGFVCVERSSPCYKCIIAMGLDKKPTSPKLRKQKSVEKREELKKAEEEGTGVEEVRTAVEEMERKGKQQAWEDGREDTLQYEYEEDFEADEEKRDERANKEGRADGRPDEMAQSPLDDDKDRVGPGEKSEASSQQAPGAGGGGNGQGEGCSESELEDDTQDIKTESSSSSRSHPYSSCSEDESAPGDREARAGNSADESARSSSSQELSESDEPGESHLPIKDSLKIEIEDQDIIKADVETKPLQVEESLENVLEEETKKGTQVIAEGLPEKPREHVSKEEKENYRNNLWEGSTAKVKDRKAGLYRVEKGAGQISGGAGEPGCHCPHDAEPGVSSTHEGEKLLTEPEIGTGAAPSRNLAVGESTALDPNKKPKPAAWEAHTREKEAAVREDEAPRHRDPGTAEEKGGALWGKAGAPAVPLGEWTPTAEQPAFVGRFAEERETPQGTAIEAGAGGDRELQGGGLHPMGKGAARASGGLSGEGAPGERAPLRTAPEAEGAAPEGEQGLEKAACAGKAAALHSACAQEAAALREAVMPREGEARRGAAVREAVMPQEGAAQRGAAVREAVMPQEGEARRGAAVRVAVMPQEGEAWRGAAVREAVMPQEGEARRGAAVREAVMPQEGEARRGAAVRVAVMPQEGEARRGAAVREAVMPQEGEARRGAAVREAVMPQEGEARRGAAVREAVMPQEGEARRGAAVREAVMPQEGEARRGAAVRVAVMPQEGEARRGAAVREAVMPQEGEARRGAAVREAVMPQEGEARRGAAVREAVMPQEGEARRGAAVREAVMPQEGEARRGAAVREAVMPQEGEAQRGAAVREAGSETPDVEASEEEASIGLADGAPEEDTASERGDGSAGAALGPEEAARAGKAGGRAATPLSPASEKAGTAPRGAAEESLPGLSEEDEGGKEAGPEAESSPKDARRETLPEALDTTGGRGQAERPKTPSWETESGRGEVTRAKAAQAEALLEEEQKFKGEEGETQGPPDELECDVENAAPTEASAWAEGTGPPGEGALSERAVALFEAAPGFEKPPENIRAARKEEGGETLREAGGTGLKGRGQPPCGENRGNPAPSEQEDGPGPGAEGVAGAPEGDPAGQPQAAEVTITAAGEAQERAAEGQDGLAGLGRKGKEGSSQGQQGAGATALTQEGPFEGDSTMAEKLSEEPVAEAPEGEADQECPLGTGVTKDGHPEGDGSLQGGVVVAQEDLREGAAEMAQEKRDALAGLKTAEGKTAASADPSFPDAAGEKAWRRVHELLGKTAAAEKVPAEEAALSEQGVPAVREVPVTGASEAEVRAPGEPSDLGGKAPHPGPGQKGGEADASQRAEFMGQEAGMGSCWGSREAGKAEDFRLGLTQETEPSVESPQGVAILPGEADCPGTREKQEHTVQRESEHADVSLNNKKA